MTVYLCAVFLSIVLAYAFGIRRSSEVDFKRLATYVPLLPYLFVAVLRSGVGRDTVGEWSTYPRIFALAQSGLSYSEVTQVVRIEPLYYLLNKAAAALGANSDVIYAVMSVIFLVFMYRFFVERSENVPLSLFLLFVSDVFLFSLSGIRQAAASAIAFYALKYVHQHRPLPFLLWIAAAAMFHMSAAFFLLFYFIGKRRLAAGIVALLVLLGVLLSLVPGVTRGIMGVFYGDAYFGSKWDYSDFNVIPAIATGVIVVAALANQKEMIERNSSMQLYLNITVVNLFLMFISPLLITPIRLYFLFIPASFILIPAILQTVPIRKQFARPALALLLIGAVSMQLIYELAIGNDAYGTWEYGWVFGQVASEL